MQVRAAVLQAPPLLHSLFFRPLQEAPVMLLVQVAGLLIVLEAEPLGQKLVPIHLLWFLVVVVAGVQGKPAEQLEPVVPMAEFAAAVVAALTLEAQRPYGQMPMMLAEEHDQLSVVVAVVAPTAKQQGVVGPLEELLWLLLAFSPDWKTW